MERLLKPLLVGVMLVAITFLSMSQKISLPDFYQTKKSRKYPISYEHMTSFDNKQEAIDAHLSTLDFLGIDTSKTYVNYEFDTPIFSNFLLKSDKKTCIITYVRKNEDGGFDSYFLESKNVEFEMFESDGYIFTNEKRN